MGEVQEDDMQRNRCFHVSRVFGLLAIAASASCPAMWGGAAGAAPDYRAVAASPDRTEADRNEDRRRKPVQLLEFADVRLGMHVLEIGAGAGYTAELLARTVGPNGVVYAQNAKPQVLFEKRMKSPAMKNVISVIRPFDDPVPSRAKNLDLITLILFYHDITYMPVDRARMNRRLFEALKPGGHLIVIDHAAEAGSDISVGKKLHRIDEAVVRREVEAAGFSLEADSDFLRNPDDPRTAPFFRMDEPTDRFALKFIKPR
jgi:predicted methyltransferase